MRSSQVEEEEPAKDSEREGTAGGHGVTEAKVRGNFQFNTTRQPGQVRTKKHLKLRSVLALARTVLVNW